MQTTGSRIFVMMPTAKVVAGRAAIWLQQHSTGCGNNTAIEQVQNKESSREPPNPSHLKRERAEFQRAIGQPAFQPSQAQHRLQRQANSHLLRPSFHRRAVGNFGLASDNDKVVMDARPLDPDAPCPSPPPRRRRRRQSICASPPMTTTSSSTRSRNIRVAANDHHLRRGISRLQFRILADGHDHVATEARFLRRSCIARFGTSTAFD